MKAIRARNYGGPDRLELLDLPTPEPASGQALVRIHAAGVNFIDIYQRSGLYKIPLPARLGLEGAGVVERLGPDTHGPQPGTRVAWTGVPGSYATHNTVPADRLVTLPDTITFEQAAALMLQGMTAHYLARSTFPLRAGNTCLVHAAAGGVGLLLCQLARRAGATVIGTVGSEEKARLALDAGAHHAILYTQTDFVAETRLITSGAGVEVVYDSVGKDTFEKSLECLAPRGMLVLFGQSSGPVPAFDPQVLNQRGSLFLTRPSLNHYIASRSELEERAGDLFELVGSGQLTVRIGGRFPLERVADAHAALESRSTTGKLVLTID